MSSTGSLLDHLSCRGCTGDFPADRLQGPCPSCGHTLSAVYRTDQLDGGAWRRELGGRPWTLWRYRELLPVRQGEMVASLGEGCSPCLDLGTPDELGGIRLWTKDDGGLPTGSFKSRGMTVAVSRARELGVRRLFVPSAGNAGVALAAYGARAGIPVRVYLPRQTPPAQRWACEAHGAEVIEVDGTIREAGARARSAEAGGDAFDVSTLREPYRVEGKKTMGLELWEQFPGESMPDAVVYPTGGGTGLVGMFKAFRELRSLGLLERVPRLLSVQPEGCAPVVRAIRGGEPRVGPWEAPTTIAPGLLVPAPFSSERILEAVRETHGGGVTVSDFEIRSAAESAERRWGISVSLESAAAFAALPRLRQENLVRDAETVLVYNTGRNLGEPPGGTPGSSSPIPVRAASELT